MEVVLQQVMLANAWPNAIGLSQKEGDFCCIYEAQCLPAGQGRVWEKAAMAYFRKLLWIVQAAITVLPETAAS